MPSTTDPADWVPTWKEWPEHDAWPHYYLGEGAKQWRNGREGGAWLAGLVNAIPEKCARVEIEGDWVAGAVLAMLEGGLGVAPYAKNDDRETFEVHVGFLPWGPEPISGATYAPSVDGPEVHGVLVSP